MLESISKASKVPVIALALPLMLRPLLRHRAPFFSIDDAL
jgi:hypothetical protein